MKTAVLVFVLGVAATASVAQEAYKCKSGSGYIYQETPCGTVPLKKSASEERQVTAAELQAQFERERDAVASRKASGVPIAVPSDARGTYWLMDSIVKEGANRIIVTRRSGTSGETWSRRVFNCSAYTVKYLGTGSTRAAMDSSKPDTNMANVLPGTIADDVGRVACQGFNVSSIVAGRDGEAVAAQTKSADLLAAANKRDDPARLAAAEHAVKRRLKDPGSASFSGMFVSWFSGGPVICGRVNARNSFGGFAGATRFVAAGNDTAFLESEMAPGEMTKTWSKFCGYRD